MHLIAITGGLNVPSRRYRIRALVPYLRDVGIQLDELCPRSSRYPPRSQWLRLPWLIAALSERLTFIARARGRDAVILQRELISTLPTIEGLLPGPRILDVDDAIFLRRRGRAARHAARCSIGVVCGNGYLAEHFAAWCPRVAVIPTGIDTKALQPSPARDPELPPSIGWIGTAANLQYLHPIANSLRRALAAVPGCELHIICDSARDLPPELRGHIRFTRWRPDIEVAELPRWNIGIMPLADNSWTRGKCAFKLLQYLAAGIPVVASPVGMNGEVLAEAAVGYAANTNDDWTSALISLLTDPDGARTMGANGRRLVERRYSLTEIAKRWRDTAGSWLSS
jgi:glycosyltransferase involved in cell wall biosynthesis